MVSEAHRWSWTQGATIEKARANLREAVTLVLEANRALASEDGEGAGVI